MVQMILARRDADFAVAGSAIGCGLLAGLLALNLSPQSGANITNVVRETLQQRLYSLGPFTAVSSFPSIARGNSRALNSAPTRTTKDIRYIHTSSAMATPVDP
jgi:hypothetical protein